MNEPGKMTDQEWANQILSDLSGNNLEWCTPEEKIQFAQVLVLSSIAYSLEKIADYLCGKKG